MKRLRTAWANAKGRAFPPGSVTFQLGAWSRGELSEADGEAVRDLLAAHRFEKLLVLHASALEVGSGAMLVAGPAGTGKSTACREVVRRGLATFVEDGLAIAGEAEGRWTLVETGTLEVLRRASLLASGPRRLLPRRSGALHDARARSVSRLARLHRAVDGMAFRGGVLLAPFRPGGLARRLLPVDRLVVLERAGEPSGSFEVSGGGMQPIADLAARAPAGVEVRRLDGSGRRAGLADRLVEALRR